jgi:hypothetical protein
MGGADLPRILTADGCRRLGIGPGQVRTELRRGRWRRVASGVLLTRPEPPTRTDWIQVGLALTGDRSAVSGWDAVRVRGLGTPTPPHRHVLLLTAGGRHRVVGGVHIRPSARPLQVSTVSCDHPDLPAVPVASTARAISDTAAYHRYLAPVRAMATAAVQRGLCRPEELAAELDHGPRGGSYYFRRAVADVIDGALSIAEAEAIALLRARKVAPFEVNAPIFDASGRMVAVADALWPELRAVLEIDSREFHFDELGWKRTMRRHNALARLGYAVAHYPPSEVRSRGVLWADEVADWLAARARELARPR